ncbi:NADH:flavin oxidoreductase/NADH oxidase [Methylovorus glucosotrophus]|uniref:NADH:flavin oxidoreductase/NADH oxidase n=1 Tax=Methylovorus glucosotrophus (strain SIP3-4) TaxID=582744 RepID=C6XC03_METGS|nr:NADH:flavin oxidoreductase/NADH oxidase [Methylovorus glucosotrophus]ACT50078.1 NADH:flavin oxidoreductase/NADH oxidase [Methylovorus glucosotrophus SIP3-4]
MAHLFTPITLRELTIRNRIFVSPMCQYSAIEGMPNDWHLVHLGSFARGGAGLVMVEATGVLPEGRITPQCLGLWNDTQRDALHRIVDFIHGQGASAAIQLAHAGRKASSTRPWEGSTGIPVAQGGWETVAPSAIVFSPQHATPQALDKAGIARISDAFMAAADRALAAGFDVIELHCAHGYLLHEFLSPLANQRDDEYGGSLENRCRLPLEIAKRLRDFWPQDKPVFVRISASDWIEGGWDIAQSVQFARWLKEIGIDLIDCSSGGLIYDAVIPTGPGYQTEFASRIRNEAGIASGAVGMITTSTQAEHILATHQADVIFMARTLLSDPHWPLHAARELRADHPWPLQYERAKSF